MKKLILVVVVAMLFANHPAFGQQNGAKPSDGAQTKPVRSTRPAPSHGSRPAAAGSHRRTENRDRKAPKQTVARTNGGSRSVHSSANRGTQATAAAKKHDASYRTKEQVKQKLLRDHKPSLPGTPKRQDGKCTVPGVGGLMDKSPYIRPVCKKHDKEYRKNGGTAWSWLRTAWRSATGQKAKDPVDQANREAAKGVWRGLKKHAEDVREKP
jgi:hypothetical protein